MSLIDDVQTEQEKPLETLNNEDVMQSRLNKLTTQLNEANIVIAKLEEENGHLAFVIKEMRIKPSSTRFKALMGKIVDTARKYKLQSPIIRK